MGSEQLLLYTLVMGLQVFTLLFQAKNLKLTVIHEISVEADTTGYKPPPPEEDEEEELRPDLLHAQTLSPDLQNNQTLRLHPKTKEIENVKLPEFIELAGTVTQ